jgi:peptidoglycan/LPS O-acetylase OafA/YrhL
LFIQILKYFAVNYFELKSGQIAFGDWYTLKDFVANLFLIQAIFNYFYVFSWNGAAWSISTEFYVYIIFGILFMITQKKLIPFVIFIYLLNKNLNFFPISYFDNFLSIFNAVFFYCIFYFSAGCFLYYIYKYLHNRIVINNFFSIFFFFILLLLKYFNENLFIKYNSIIFASIIIVSLLLEKKTYVYKFLNLKPLVFLGTISYSFYLIHQVVIYLFIQFCRFILKIDFPVDIKSGSVSNTGNIFYDTIIHLNYIVLKVLISYLIFKFIEEPLRKK